jgi:hypothetical protein
MTRTGFRGWVTGNQQEILIFGLALLAGWQFGRVAGRHECRDDRPAR